MIKTKIIIFTVLLITIGAAARIISPFPGWDRLKEWSNDIVIARCGEPVSVTLGTGINNAPKFNSNIEIIYILKGTNSTHLARLETDHRLLSGEDYLVFGNYNGDAYQANEGYRVIPLGVNFSTNSIAGKPLEEQMQILFQQSVNHLNREIQKDQEEKQRLEEGLKQ